ncbi:MAG: hypothetical protein A4E55_01778 [Pelotomaculum sp. PtaU1.Bin035]|nr:MAG: hypothetical protein A4E55_01778 [Pelotomaculum sp. PtaU1.Bin035]
MSKLYRQPVEVRLYPSGQPAAFRWRRRWYHVTSCTVQERRPSRLQWWVDIPRYRCETEQGLVCDLVREGDGGMLEWVWD